MLYINFHCLNKSIKYTIHWRKKYLNKYDLYLEKYLYLYINFNTYRNSADTTMNVQVYSQEEALAPLLEFPNSSAKFLNLVYSKICLHFAFP